jgi:hypothetical protein
MSTTLSHLRGRSPGSWSQAGANCQHDETLGRNLPALWLRRNRKRFSLPDHPKKQLASRSRGESPFLQTPPRGSSRGTNFEETIMAGRGPQSFKKRQKEQARKERQDEKKAKKMERKLNPEQPETDEELIAQAMADRLSLIADPDDVPVEHLQNS